ncbi:hypothetical protein GCM10023187_29130 [Nibrella viscosa]|uniref:Uncharacterized protein n=2 Tax=Nibrella viscosa TaxID=1084524 RepID=A0ABP8KII9_9BACT
MAAVASIKQDDPKGKSAEHRKNGMTREQKAEWRERHKAEMKAKQDDNSERVKELKEKNKDNRGQHRGHDKKGG